MHQSWEAQRLGALQVSSYKEATNLRSMFDLSFDFVETGDTIQVSLVYNSDIYTERTVERMLEHLEQLLAAVVAQPDAPINTINYLSGEEQHKLLAAFNA